MSRGRTPLKLEFRSNESNIFLELTFEDRRESLHYLWQALGKMELRQVRRLSESNSVEW